MVQHLRVAIPLLVHHYKCLKKQFYLTDIESYSSMSKTIIKTRKADENHQVVTFTLQDDNRNRQKRPCKTCPWRKDKVGIFPAEAFRHSAPTGYDIPELIASGEMPSTFACHKTGLKAPSTCAGFLLAESSNHNLSLRMAQMRGEDVLSGVQKGEAPLFDNYYDMAVANGVPTDDPRITPCWRPKKNNPDR